MTYGRTYLSIGHAVEFLFTGINADCLTCHETEFLAGHVLCVIVDRTVADVSVPCHSAAAGSRCNPMSLMCKCRSGAPLASRWSPASNKPWQVVLPLSPEVPGAQALQVSVGVAVEPWVYKAGFSPGLPGGHQRTPGPRVVILQVVEGEENQGAVQLSALRRCFGFLTHWWAVWASDVIRFVERCAPCSCVSLGMVSRLALAALVM